MFCFKVLRLNLIALTSWIAILILPGACKPDIKQSGTALKYFNITGFFKQDTAKLNHLHLTILKSVTHNNNTETRVVTIKDWGRELDFFINSDINKPAWRDSYTIAGDSGLLVYRAKEPDLKMRQMVIKKSNGKIKWILVFNRITNKLYKSYEKLTYYPDSLYLIEKMQKVRFLGTNNYKIEGIIKK